MKLRIKSFGVFSILILTILLLSTTHAYAEETKLLEDPNLETAVRDVLQKYDGEITKEDLGKLETLYQTRKGLTVSSLKGLEYATNLYSLYFDHNNISDVSPIANLPKLTKVGLGSNKLTDIRSLGALPSLLSIGLNHNEIEDVTVLANSPNIQQLSINHNQIKDISKLSGLTNLTFLNIEENKITDISAVASFHKLETLMADDNQIKDLTPLSGLSLYSIQLNNNKVTDVTPLSTLKELGNLRIAGNQLQNISPLAKLTQLTLLEIAHNQIEDISPLKGLNKIAGLYMAKNRIHDLSPLSGTTFSTVDLRENNVSDISPLVDMKKMHSILLSKNSITDISPLSKISNLKMADVSANPLNDHSLDVIAQMHLSGIVIKSGYIYYENCNYDCIPLWINGKEQITNNRMFTQDGRMMIALREIFELLGATVSWDPETYQITASRRERKVSVQIDSKSADVNGTSVTLDVAPMLVDNSTYVPLRFVSEALGAKVEWNQMGQSVSITTD
ncbi:leucine-rich repeat domain-containing protein [Paenibacillus hexagrammi]|uniref:Leucine-rich repeat domain-containing protein n=1 Tax=Paenibacillus hexagrammi TaxID=2908839 RepID=A0ABY3SR58_9BACL|nr:leucine-rich repeat domain-containing protein [Paenibacillus sp. YPD9-1]UJF35739.1 leucine-rich repeat domain-containing protein [Paenibacillus sp. YPD9-1]